MSVQPLETPEYRRLVGDVLHRRDAGSFYRLGIALFGVNQWGAAGACIAQTVARAGRSAATMRDLGWTLHEGGRSVEGREWLERADGVQPHSADILMMLSQVVAALGEDETALDYALRAARLGSSAGVNRVALAFAFFFNGRWADGWREYEGRFDYKLPDFLKRPYPMWDGSSVGTLHIEAEQGLGDALFGLRWVMPAAERCERLVLSVQKELVGLLTGFPAKVEVRALPDFGGGVDAWLPVMSLPHVLGLGEPFETEVPGVGEQFLWRDPGGKPLKVGICWAGSPEHAYAHHRDCPMAYFLRLGEVPGVELHSLQVGPGAVQLDELLARGVVHDSAAGITNMADTARVIGGLDLVITVDTAVAHLAGLLGCPTWLLLNQRGLDFRWGRGDADDGWTDWYPTIDMFRRRLDEDWPSLMNEVRDALARRASR